MRIEIEFGDGVTSILISLNRSSVLAYLVRRFRRYSYPSRKSPRSRRVFKLNAPALGQRIAEVKVLPEAARAAVEIPIAARPAG